MQLLLTVLIISILYGAEIDLFIPSFPEIQQVFNLSPFLVQLTLSANFLSYAICAIFVGSLGDRFNRRTVILISLAIFVMASLLCVCATHYSILVLGRFLQGVGMAGPAVLAYVVIADTYPVKKQVSIMGLLNGVSTLAMACAPVVGSYVNLYFGWRANFIVLLALSILSFVSSYLFIQDHQGDASVSLSLRTYIPLLTSAKLMIFILGLSMLGICYWVFIGMAPILYMKHLGITLNRFGYYQGAIALAFGIVSVLSPKIINMFGIKKCLHYSLAACLLGATSVLLISVLGYNSAKAITAAMILFSAAAVFPVQILFPITLEIIENSKARISALINSIRLVFTAIFLELLSYFFGGTFFLLGIAITTLILLALFLIWQILKNKWVQIE